MKHLSDYPDAHLRIFERTPVPAPDGIRDVYLIGICGTGMGSLAGLLREAGYEVRGSDEAAYPPMSTRLVEMGILVYEGYDAAHLDPSPDLVVVGNACTPTHPEAAFAREKGLPQLSLPEALAHFFLSRRRTIVVAGTHGKTTTTGMLVHVFREAGLDPAFLVGGVMANGNASYGLGSGPHFIIEGDEYDSAYFDKRPKFMHYPASAAIVTSIEFDHADIYDDLGDYRSAFADFAASIPSGHFLALCGDDPEVRELANGGYARACLYGIDSDQLGITAREVMSVDGGQAFTLDRDGEDLGRIFLPMSGRHNLRNALAVCAVALDEGISPEALAAAFSTFRGLKRRQEIRGEANGVIVIDDFAHHPTAVRETTAAVAERYPGRRIVAVFEPRSNSSRRKIFEAAYSEAFDAAGAVFLSAPPVRHNDTASNLLDEQTVVRELTRRGVRASAHHGADDLLPHLLDELRTGDVVLIMSNGAFGGIHEKLLSALQPTTEDRLSATSPLPHLQPFDEV